MEDSKKQLLNFTEAALFIRYSTSWLRQHYKKENIKHLKLSARKIFFLEEDLLEWMYSKRVGCEGIRRLV